MGRFESLTTGGTGRTEENRCSTNGTPLLEFLEQAFAGCVQSEYPNNQDKFVLAKACRVGEGCVANSSWAGDRSGSHDTILYRHDQGRALPNTSVTWHR